jgi:hypothetical protein
VNLSQYPASPMMLQAYRVFEATEKRHDAFYAKWRYKWLEGVRSPTDFTPFKSGVNNNLPDGDEVSAMQEQVRWNRAKPHAFALTKTAAPDFSKIVREVACPAFLPDRVRIRVEIDSKTFRRFEPPLCLHGNFSYAPQYAWAILETKGYYADVPVVMADDGSRGDRRAGDGVYTVDLYLRKNCGTLEFEVQDGLYVREYWNFFDPPSHRNPALDRLTAACGKRLGKLNDKSNRIRISTASDTTLVWDRKTAAAVSPPAD